MTASGEDGAGGADAGATASRVQPAAVRARGLLALVRGAGTGLCRLPRPAAVALAIAWMGLSWWLSSGPRGPRDGGPVWAYVSNLAHAPLFGLLALWWVAALPRRRQPFTWARLDGRDVAVVLALVLAWGLVDEWHQSGVDGRRASWADLVTDAVGAASVLVVAAHAGRPDATAAGLARRLLVGLLACLLAAAVATIT